jgi:hypothetical protein
VLHGRAAWSASAWYVYDSINELATWLTLFN